MFKYDKQTCVIVVDVQNDFALPDGALSVKDGDKIIPYVNKLIAEITEAGGLIVYTQDWHPENHCSFKENGGIWPAHCVQNTYGAALHDDLRGSGRIFEKGADPNKDSYSGFGGTTVVREVSTSLETYLKDRGIKKVIVVGLAGDYCVKATAIDAKKLGFETLVDLEGTKFVFPENREVVMKELIENFVMVLE